MSMRYKGSRLSATANTPTSLTASGAWTLQQQMQANGTSTWPFVRDPQFNYVTMLLHGDGSAGANNGSGGGATPTVTNFNADASTNNFNVTINGDARSDNFNPYQSGYYSNSFNGSSSYLGVSAATIAATGQFCIEAWVYQASRSTGTDQMIFSQYTGGVSGRFYLRFNVDKLSFTTSAGDNSGATTLNTNVWYHVAVTRDASNVVRLFVNGILDLSATVTQSLQVTTPQIGAAAASSLWNGYISNLRTVSGSIPTSYQTSSTTVGTVVFTPSTSPLTTTSQGASGTSLLTCQSNRFIDNSASALTVTSTSTSISPAQPFTLPSSVATYGSGYFDGTGDTLTTSTSQIIPTGSFTVECWAYVTGTGSNQKFVAQGSSGAAGRFSLGIEGGNWWVQLGGDAIQTGTPVKNQWNYVAVTYNGSTITLYVNGTSIGTVSSTANAQNTTLTIGQDWNSYIVTGYVADVRISNTVRTITTPTAPYSSDANTRLLTTQYNGGGNNSGFKDSSLNNFPITRNGNTTQGTFAPYGSNWSNNFGSANFFYSASNAAFAFGTGDFTVEAWVNPSSYGTLSYVLGVAVTDGLVFYVNSGNLVVRAYNTGDLLSSSTIPAIGAWTHVAATRSGTTLRIFVNGVQTATTTNSTNFAQGAIYAGNDSTNAAPWFGYISNLRVVKGTAVYTSNFTPSTTPLTAVSGTSWLVCQSNRFVDNSSNAFTITTSGSPSVQRFSPFANATAYNPATLGGSAYFDGTGDYLSFPNTSALSFGTGDFTVEAWVYKFNASNASIIDSRVSGNASPWAFFVDGSNFPYFYDATVYTSSISIVLNTWNHVAVTRSSGTLKIFVNGVQGYSATVTTNLDRTGGYQLIGADVTGGASFWNGYISNFRVAKGTALYTAAFTPPTAPLTPTPSTQLLLSNTNSAILDQSMMNDLETVGNAQISTSVVKYGTASMYFNGSTSNRIRPPASVNFAFGTGNFTVEAWVYVTDLSTENFVFDTRSSVSTSGMGFSLEPSTGKLRYSGSANNVLTSTGVSANVWTHVAWVRNGSTLTGYINGVSGGSASNSDNLTQTNGEVGNVPFATTVGTNMYIDDLRITKGYARYTANFTPPTQALPNG